MNKDVLINSSKTSSYKKELKYYGNYLGIVIQNNDPEKAGKVKIWVPHISPTVYNNWDNTSIDKKFNFIGSNVDSDITDIVEDLKAILPWAICAAPLNGASSSGRYNAFEKTATISDSSNKDDQDFDTNFTKTKYSLNNDGIGEKPARKYEINETKITDAFVNAGDIPFENANKFGYNYTPTSYSNSAKGSFSIPNVGSHVWVFFDGGDPLSPVYFAVSYGDSDWKSIYDTFTNDPGLDYPGAAENKNSSIQEYNHNTTTYRNKYVINQKGGSIEMVNTDNRELLKLTHYSGSFKEFSNSVNTEFAINNDQKLVQNDQFLTVNGNQSTFIKEDVDCIINGDRYKKIGNINYNVFKEYKNLLDSVADAKQLFDIKRATAVATSGFFKKTSPSQTRSGSFGPCPVCTASDRDQFWDNKYSFNAVRRIPTYDRSFTSFDFDEDVSSVYDEVASVVTSASGPSNFLGSGSCPVCGGSGKSPSTSNGSWAEEDKVNLVINRLQTINEDLIDLEKQMGKGGNEIVTITKNKIDNIGLVFNDFPSIRVDSVGKIDISEVKVFEKGAITLQEPRALFEYVHVDDLPGGTYVQNINNKWNVQVGAGGVSIKTVGGLDISGAITNIAGQQTNIVSEEEINIDGKVVNISAEILMLRNKRKQQVVVDGNFGVNQNVAIAGAMHVEGEVSLHHITAPIEIQESYASTTRGKMIGGSIINFSDFTTRGMGEHGTSGMIRISLTESHDVVEIYPHTHAFPNVPLKLLKTKDDVRKVGAATSGTSKAPAIPVHHERKIGESF